MSDMQTEPTLAELRIIARLAWNNWPDTEATRRTIMEHESRDQHSADAWDRVVAAVLCRPKDRHAWHRAKSAKARAATAEKYDAIIAGLESGLTIAQAAKAAGSSDTRVWGALRWDKEFAARVRAANRHTKSTTPLLPETVNRILDAIESGVLVHEALRRENIGHARFDWNAARDPLLKKRLREAKLAGAKKRDSVTLKHAEEILTRLEAGESIRAITASDDRYPDRAGFLVALKRFPVLHKRYDAAIEANQNRVRAAINATADGNDVVAMIEKAIPKDNEFRDDVLSETFIAFAEGRVRLDGIKEFVRSLIKRYVIEQKKALSLDETISGDSNTTRGDLLSNDW